MIVTRGGALVEDEMKSTKPLLHQARQLAESKLSIIPIRADGSKAPALERPPLKGRRAVSVQKKSKANDLVRASKRTLVDPRLTGWEYEIEEFERFIDEHHPKYKDHEVRVNVVKEWNGELHHLIGDSDSDEKIAVHLGSCPKTINFTLVSDSAYPSLYCHRLDTVFRTALRYGILLGWGVPIVFGDKKGHEKEVAYHEAGHAVIGHWLGKTIKWANIGYVVWERGKNPLPPELEALVHLAGPLAQIKYNPGSDADQSAGGDQMNLDKRLKLMKETMEPEEYEATASALTVRCQGLLNDHWAEVEEVAELLIASIGYCEETRGSNVVYVIRRTIKDQMKIVKSGKKWIVTDTDPGWLSAKNFPTKWQAEVALEVYLKGGRVSDYWEATLVSAPRLEEIRRKYAKVGIPGCTQVTVCRAPWDRKKADVPFSVLSDFHLRKEEWDAYAYLYARCSQMPEELENSSGLVCITKGNNPKELYLTLLAKAALPIGSVTQKEECQK